VTAISTNFFGQNLVCNLFEFTMTKITWILIFLTFKIQSLRNKLHWILLIIIFSTIPKGHPNFSYLIEQWTFKCGHILNWFFFPKLGLLWFIWILDDKNHSKFNLSHPNSKSYEMYSIKSCFSKYFQEHQRHIPILLKFSVMI
jgi:glycerol-3-phosphate acyltransferase PlsY